MLADLVLASRGEVNDEDRARLDAELNGDAVLRKWLDAVAPGLRNDHGLRARIAARPTAPETGGGEPTPDATIKRLEGSG